jgi:hypothetical protein
MKPKSNPDDESTVSIRRPPPEDVSTVALPGSGKKQPKTSPAGETEMDLVHSYWRSGLPALKRQAISRYTQLLGGTAEQAEAALTAWTSQQGAKK